MFDVRGKIGLVTGGGQGIGLAIVKELLRNELKSVSILDVEEEASQRALIEIREEFGEGRAIFLKVDVANRDQFEDAFRNTVQQFGNLDIVINNAGVSGEREWAKQISINFTGVVTGTILAFEDYLPKYKIGREGVILNVSSIASLDLFPSAPVYTAAKCGIVALTRSMGHPLHYKRKNVKLMAICPGFTTTAMCNIRNETFFNEEYAQINEDYLRDASIVFQDPEDVARSALQIIKDGQSGSVWISENKEPPYEVVHPSREQIKKL